MKITNRLLTIVILSCSMLLFCSCQYWDDISPADYPGSIWLVGEEDIIQIEMHVQKNRTTYSFITYNGETKKYDTTFPPNEIGFWELDSENKHVYFDGYGVGFGAEIVKALDGEIQCKMSLKEFMFFFTGSDDGVENKYYYFTLYMQK